MVCSMKIKVKDLLVVLIYILIFVAAITHMRFTVVEIRNWIIMYDLALLAAAYLSVLYFILVLSRKQIKLKVLPVLLFVIVGYELLTSAFNSMFNIPSIFIHVLPWPFVFCVFYHYSIDNEIPACLNLITLFCISIIFVLAIPNIIKARIFGDGDAIFTTFYSFAFLPFVYLCCNNKISKIYSIIVILLMLFTLKRSAFIIVIVGNFLYYLLQTYINNSKSKTYTNNSKSKKIKKILFFFMIVVAFGLAGDYLIEKFNLPIYERLSNSINDGGSGRLAIWDQVFWYYSNSSTVEKFFGHGFHAVYYEIQPLGMARFAHNSFLEILYDYGILGLTLILSVFVTILTKTYKMIIEKCKFAPVMGFASVSMTVLATISYFFEVSGLIIPFSAVWGLCIGGFARDKKEEENES